MAISDYWKTRDCPCFDFVFPVVKSPSAWRFIFQIPQANPTVFMLLTSPRGFCCGGWGVHDATGQIFLLVSPHAREPCNVLFSSILLSSLAASPVFSWCLPCCPLTPQEGVLLRLVPLSGSVFLLLGPRVGLDSTAVSLVQSRRFFLHRLVICARVVMSATVCFQR